MSIEETMKLQADAMNNLAAAMNNYASVMQAVAAGNPGSVVAPAAAAGQPTTDAAPPEKKKGGRPPKDKTPPAADAIDEAANAFGEGEAEEDPFGEEPAAPAQKALTAEDIRGLVLKVKAKNKDHALALLKKIGVSTLGQIQEKDFEKVVELAGKVGVTL